MLLTGHAAHRLSGDRRANPLPPRLPAHRPRSGAQRSISAESDPLDLFSACEPPLLYVTLPNGDTRSGLTYERLRTMVENRLRVAQLYRVGAVGPPPWPLLRVDVLVYQGVLLPDGRVAGGGVYSIKVELRKRVRDFFGASGGATTWSKDLVDAFAGDAPVDRILQFVSEIVDDFTLEYLRVNEAAC